MNKRKRVAILKHRHKAKKLEEKRRALVSGGVNRPAVRVAPKKEMEMPKPVKALAEILKSKEAVVAKKPATKKAEPVEKVTKAPVRKKKPEPVDEATPTAQTDSSKKIRVKKKKPESSEAG